MSRASPARRRAAIAGARSSRRSPTRSPAISSSARLRRPAIVGHSMGGTLAMMIGARHPGLVGRIMVVDMLPEPAGLVGGSAAGAGALANSLLAGDERPPPVRLADQRFQPARFEPAHQRPRRRRAHHERAGGDRPDARRCPASARRSPSSTPPGTAAPPPRSTALFARAYAGARDARFVRIDDSGHMVMLDQPARLRGGDQGVSGALSR